MNYGQLILRHPGNIGFGMLHYFFSSLGQTFLISLFVPHFGKQIEISNAEFSILYAIATISSATILPFLGKYIDRLRIRTTSLINGLTIAAFCFFISFSNNFYHLLIAILGLRLCGQGLMILIGGTAIARYFVLDRGKALSLSGLGISLAEASLPILITFLIGNYGWDGSWRILSIATLLIFIPLSIISVKKDHPFQYANTNAQYEENLVSNATRRDVLKDRYFYLILPVLLFLPFFITGMFIHQNLMAAAKGWGMEWMATCFVGFGIIRILTSIVAGPLVDRFSAKRVFVIYLLPLSVGLLFLLAGDHRLYAMLYMIFLGITASLSSLTSTALWAELYGVQHLGSIKSMITTMMVLSTAIGPVVIGSILEGSANLQLFLLFSIFVIVILTIMAAWAIRKKSLNSNKLTS